MKAPVRCVLAMRLFNEAGTKCFGPGIHKLLRGVERSGSLRAAAMEMGMAYSKAWRIVREMEASLETPLLSSVTGGVHGGGAVLTPEAIDLLARYDAFTHEIEQAASKSFQRFFLE